MSGAALHGGTTWALEFPHDHVLSLSVFKSSRYPLRSRGLELTRRGRFGNYRIIETLECCQPILLLLHNNLRQLHLKPATFGDRCYRCNKHSPFHVFTDIIIKNYEVLRPIAHQEWSFREPHRILNLQLHRPAENVHLCCLEAPAVFLLAGSGKCAYKCKPNEECLFSCSVEVKIKTKE
jgi:hypothetical protein